MRAWVDEGLQPAHRRFRCHRTASAQRSGAGAREGAGRRPAQRLSAARLRRSSRIPGDRRLPLIVLIENRGRPLLGKADRVQPLAEAIGDTIGEDTRIILLQQSLLELAPQRIVVDDQIVIVVATIANDADSVAAVSPATLAWVSAPDRQSQQC